MDATPLRRPPAVTIVGWIYIAAGALAVAGAWLGLAGWWAMVGLRRGYLLQAPPGAPWPLAWLSKLFVVFDVVALLQIGAGVLAIVAGSQFLRLRPWTRPVLEALGWVALVVALLVGILWESTWLAVMTRIAAAATIQQRLAAVMGVLMGTVMVVVWSLPAAVVIKILRGPTVRQALARMR